MAAMTELVCAKGLHGFYKLPSDGVVHLDDHLAHTRPPAARQPAQHGELVAFDVHLEEVHVVATRRLPVARRILATACALYEADFACYYGAQGSCAALVRRAIEVRSSLCWSR